MPVLSTATLRGGWLSWLTMVRQRLSTGMRDNIRSTRSAPVFGLNGCDDPGEVVEALWALPARGRCDALATELARHGAQTVLKCAGLTHRAGSPAAAMAATRAPTGALQQASRRRTLSWSVRPSDANDPLCSRRAIVRAAVNSYPDRAFEAVSNPLCPPAVVAALPRSTEPTQRARAAANPALWPGWAIVDEDETVRSAVAANPTCTPAILATLAADPQWLVRSSAAAHPATTMDLLTSLASDPDQWVRRRAAANPNCSGAVIRKVSVDDHPVARSGVAANPNTRMDVLARLATDPDGEPRGAVAARKGCPPSASS